MVKYMHAFTVGALHELIGLPEHGELELCERLEKEELVHLNWFGPVLAKLCKPVGAALSPGEADWEDLGEAGAGQEREVKRFALVLPVPRVGRRKHRSEQERGEV